MVMDGRIGQHSLVLVIHKEYLFNYKISVHGEVAGLQKCVFSGILSHHSVKKHVACHWLLVDSELIDLAILHGKDILKLWQIAKLCHLYLVLCLLSNLLLLIVLDLPNYTLKERQV